MSGADRDGDAVGGAIDFRTPTAGGDPYTKFSVRGQIDQRLDRLKSAVLAEFSGDGQPLLAEIGTTMAMLDAVLARLDHTLAAHLADAHSAAQPQARTAALAKCEALLASHRAYIDAEPLIGHIDDNPLGLPMGIRALVDDALGRIEQALRH